MCAQKQFGYLLSKVFMPKNNDCSCTCTHIYKHHLYMPHDEHAASPRCNDNKSTENIFSFMLKLHSPKYNALFICCNISWCYGLFGEMSFSIKVLLSAHCRTVVKCFGLNINIWGQYYLSLYVYAYEVYIYIYMCIYLYQKMSIDSRVDEFIMTSNGNQIGVAWQV